MKRFNYQAQVGEGETLGLVILSSDKTTLSRHQGDKECHGLFMTCGNIRKEIRGKASADCWLMIAQIPIVKFEEDKCQGMLSNRLYHHCLDIVTEYLKKCSHQPVEAYDPYGHIRLLRTILLAHIADLPEQ